MITNGSELKASLEDLKASQLVHLKLATTTSIWNILPIFRIPEILLTFAKALSWELVDNLADWRDSQFEWWEKMPINTMSITQPISKIAVILSNIRTINSVELGANLVGLRPSKLDLKRKMIDLSDYQ